MTDPRLDDTTVGPLCPEHYLRAAMTDDEFWAHVYPDTLPPRWDDQPSTIDLEDMASMSHLANPCPECGQWGACAYDAEGRPMIHMEDPRG